MALGLWSLVFLRLMYLNNFCQRPKTQNRHSDMKQKYGTKKFTSKSDSSQKKPPPVETLAETYYYRKQMENATKMVIVLQNGEEIEGTIEWYDKEALKINRDDAPNLLLFKQNIKYLFKAEERELDYKELSE